MILDRELTQTEAKNLPNYRSTLLGITIRFKEKKHTKEEKTVKDYFVVQNQPLFVSFSVL